MSFIQHSERDAVYVPPNSRGYRNRNCRQENQTAKNQNIAWNRNKSAINVPNGSQYGIGNFTARNRGTVDNGVNLDNDDYRQSSIRRTENPNRLPVLFSVIEDWDSEPSYPPEDEGSNEICETDSNKVEMSREQNSTKTKNEKLAAAETAKIEPVLPFIRFMKVDKGGDFAPIDKVSEESPQLVTTAKWPKTMRRSLETRLSSRDYDEDSRQTAAAVTGRTTSCDFQHDDDNFESRDLVCDPKPTFAPLRRVKTDLLDADGRNGRRIAATIGQKHSNKNNETFRILKTSELFGDDVEESGKKKFLHNQLDPKREENIRFVKPYEALDAKCRNENSTDSKTTAFTQIKPKPLQQSNGYCDIENSFLGTTSLRLLSNAVGNNAPGTDRSTKIGSNSSYSSPSSLSNRSALSSPDVFKPIMVENDDVTFLPSHQSTNDSFRRSENLVDSVANQFKFCSFNGNMMPSVDSQSATVVQKSTLERSQICDQHCNNNMKNSGNIKPAVFNIYQQYEQYGLEDDFQFPSAINSSNNFAVNGAANCSSPCSSSSSSSSVQNGHLKSSLAVQFPRSNDLYGQSLFSCQP